MRTKALLNESGQLTARISIRLIFENGRIIRQTREGHSQATNVKRNFDRMINTAVLDVRYRVLAEKGIDPKDYNIIVDYDLKDYYIDYLHEYRKRERFRYVESRKDGQRFITLYDDDNHGRIVSRDVVETKSITEIRKEQVLFHQQLRTRKDTKYVRFKNYIQPSRKVVDFSKNDERIKEQRELRQFMKRFKEKEQRGKRKKKY